MEDPLTELYSSWSPYIYTVNNTIVLIDPNGKWISVYGSNGTQYRYENGEMKKQNKESEWVADYYFGGDN
ncbi:hypothetical protein [Sphingobacterium endophyticum]|uniref:hypothetical protein n=1 Tax=Sphingobacterium endophyticum TaxID=2546448 RepID=UPI0012E24AD5|nr:hypothetical protein [Sphingobacterium endophyticum]